MGAVYHTALLNSTKDGFHEIESPIGENGVSAEGKEDIKRKKAIFRLALRDKKGEVSFLRLPAFIAVWFPQKGIERYRSPISKPRKEIKG